MWGRRGLGLLTEINIAVPLVRLCQVNARRTFWHPPDRVTSYKKIRMFRKNQVMVLQEKI